MNSIEKKNKIEKILQKILPDLVPDPNEIKDMERVINKFTTIIKSSNIPNGITINYIEPQGSTGIKNTAIKNAADIDLFIALEPYKFEDIIHKSKGKRRTIIKSSFKNLIKKWLIPTFNENNIKNVNISYAEHPYISIKHGKFELDVVLCFDIDKEYLMEYGPITAVDRSPHHSRFIKATMTEQQKNEVRLLKHLFKVHKSYGDKSYLGRSGFMGYAAELYINYFGNLLSFFENFESIDKKMIFSPQYLPDYQNRVNNKYENRPYNKIKELFFPNDYLLLLDPTDYNRNVASSISKRTFQYMKNIIKEFLENPTEIIWKKSSIKKIEDYGLPNNILSKYFFCEYKTTQPEHYTKFRDKLYSFMHKIIESSIEEFSGEKKFENVKGELIFNTKEQLYSLVFYTNTPKISEFYNRKGPKVEDDTHAKKFRIKHQDVFEKEGFFYINQKREDHQFLPFLEKMIVRENINHLNLENYGDSLSKNISELSKKALGLIHQLNIWKIE